MYTDQGDEDYRQDPNMGGKEALQCQGAQVAATAHHLQDELTHEWGATCDLGGNSGGPVGFLVPGQQVPRKAHGHGQQQQTNTDQPGQFAWVLEAGADKNTDHVNENYQHHERSTPVMDTAHQPTESDIVHDVLDTIVGVVWAGGVINGKENAGDGLQNKKEKAGTAKRVPPVAKRFWAV